jgi:hypothetical protein
MAMEKFDNPSESAKEFHKKLARTFEIDELYSLLKSLAGFGYLMSDFLMTNYTPSQLPGALRYAVIQSFSMLRLFQAVDNGEEIEFKIYHMPDNERKHDSWLNKEDFEQRLIFIVTQFYKELQAEGKIPLEAPNNVGEGNNGKDSNED